MKKIFAAIIGLTVLLSFEACKKEKEEALETKKPLTVYDEGSATVIATIDYTYPNRKIPSRPLIYGQFSLFLDKLPDTSKVKSVLIYRDGAVKFVLKKTDKEFSDSTITAGITYSYQIGYDITGYGYSKKSEVRMCTY